MRGRKLDPETGKRNDDLEYIPGQQRMEFREDGKSNCITSVSKDAMIGIDKIYYRKLTVTECERLQTLDDGYTSGVSNSQRYAMIGNGWNIETICHIFQYLKETP